MSYERTLSKDSFLVLRDEVYFVDLFDETKKEFDKDIAYVDGDYFYIYRGRKSKYDMIKPGIYIDSDTNQVVKVEPATEEERNYYSTEGKVVSHDPEEAARIINSNEDIFVPVSENCKIFNPAITPKDDFLKRILKLLFAQKEIDIDNCKDRFPDKNARFNFKQVMKGDASVTMKIFQRACDVVNVEYMIVIKERDGSYTIGKPLAKPLSISSEDTFEYGTDQLKKLTGAEYIDDDDDASEEEVDD